MGAARWIAVTLLSSVLGTAVWARAQSAVDGFDPGANSNVNAVVIQPDGKILIGGAFVAVGSGGPGADSRQFIARINVDGSLDTFDPHADGVVDSLALQPDGKILVGGSFSNIAGAPRKYIARLNPDGSIDAAFNPGADGFVEAIAVQPDGRIVAGGRFTHLGGGATVARGYIARLNANGSVDPSFTPNADNVVFALALQADGKILAGGQFSMLGGMPRNRIGRIDGGGSLDSAFDPSVTGFAVYAIAVQPGGRIVVGGNFSEISGAPRRHLARIWPDGVADPAFDPAPDFEVRRVVFEPSGSMLVGGAFRNIGGSPRLAVARLGINGGALDLDFNPGAKYLGAPDAVVYAFGIQSDGKIVAGGRFTNFGSNGVTPRFNVARVYANGALDSDFDPAPDAGVMAIAVQRDGNVVVGGAFTAIGGTTNSHIARLRPDGSVESSPPWVLDGIVNAIAPVDDYIVVGGAFLHPFPYLVRLFNGLNDSSFNPGLNDQVFAIAVQADGKILIGGAFTQIGGVGRSHIGRLNADGSLDTAFDPGANGRVLSFAVQPDGAIIVAGEFTAIGGGGSGGEPYNYLARLFPGGAVDHSFDGGANGPVYATALQPDGSVVVGGAFTTLGGDAGPTPRNGIGRLTSEGLVDPSFDAGANALVDAIALQTDGSVVIGGAFTTIDRTGVRPVARRRLARLTADGSLDGTFDPGANAVVRALAIETDGKVIAGGDFTMLGGGGTGITPRNRLGRLTNTGPASQELTVFPNGLITWIRSGTGPELSQVTFQSSLNGSSFSPLGQAERLPDGWQFSAPGLAGGRVFVRALGRFSTGQFNGGGSLTASLRHANAPAPFIDDPIVVGVTTVKAAHILELRARIDALRARFGPGPWTWTSGPVAPGGRVLAAHVAELRTALFGAFAAAGHPQPVYSDPIITPQSTIIRAVHLQELRAAILLLEAS